MRWTSKKGCAAVVVVTSLLVSGCEAPSFSFAREGVRVWGTKPLIDREKFEKINLSKEILAATQTRHSVGVEIDDALRLFYNSAPNNELKIRRDRVQERILGASKQRCGEYRNFLKEFDAQSNFLLGSLTTTLAGAGAIFTGLDTVRALSGSASIISGIRSELNEDFFQTLTIQVIADGFGARREELYRGITERQKQGITNYTLEAAIKDAVEFHENCSLLAGLEHAAKSIERAKDPGLTALSEAATKIQIFRNRLRDAVDDDDIKVKPISLTGTTGEGTAATTETAPAQAAKVPGDALVSYIKAEKTRDLLEAEIEKYKNRTLPSEAVEKYERHGTIRDGKSCPADPAQLDATPTATAADIHASELLLSQQCKRIVEDRGLAEKALHQKDAEEKKIVVDISDVLTEAGGLFSKEARNEYIELEGARIPLLANAKTAEKGPALVTATAELSLHEAKINSKIDILDGMHKKMQAKLSESNNVLRILDGLKKRILGYNEAVKALKLRVDAQTAMNSTDGADKTDKPAAAPVKPVKVEKLKAAEAPEIGKPKPVQ